MYVKKEKIAEANEINAKDQCAMRIFTAKAPNVPEKSAQNACFKFFSLKKRFFS